MYNTLDNIQKYEYQKINICIFCLNISLNLHINFILFRRQSIIFTMHGFCSLNYKILHVNFSFLKFSKQIFFKLLNKSKVSFISNYCHSTLDNIYFLIFISFRIIRIIIQYKQKLFEIKQNVEEKRNISKRKTTTMFRYDDVTVCINTDIQLHTLGLLQLNLCDVHHVGYSTFASVVI